MYQLRREVEIGRDKILCECKIKERILENLTYSAPEYNKGNHYIVKMEGEVELWDTREKFKSRVLQT